MKYLLFLLMPFIVLHAQLDKFGQPMNNTFNTNIDFFAMSKVGDKSNTNYLKGIKGSVYLFDNWNKCKIYPSNGTANFSVSCNYNVYSDQFEVKIDDNSLFILNPNSVNQINVKSKSFIPTKLSDSEAPAYVELLGENKSLKAVKVYKSNILQVQTNTLGLYESRLKINDLDYFLMSNGKLVKIPSSKSKIFDILNIAKAERKNYKKYNLKRTEELVDVIQSL